MAAEQKKILFVTAFKELGRERWTYYARRTDEYFDYFANLVQTRPPLPTASPCATTAPSTASSQSTWSASAP